MNIYLCQTLSPASRIVEMERALILEKQGIVQAYRAVLHVRMHTHFGNNQSQNGYYLTRLKSVQILLQLHPG